MDWVRTHFSIPLLVGLAYFKIEITEWEFLKFVSTQLVYKLSVHIESHSSVAVKRIFSTLYDTILKCVSVFDSVLIFDPVNPGLEKIMVKVPQFASQKFSIYLISF